MKKANKTKSEAEDQKELDAIAAKHKVKEVWRIKAFNLKGEMSISYHKKPSRTDYGSALAIQDRNPITAKEIIIRSTFLEGDQRVMTDDEFFYSACTVVDDLLQIRLADIKKN